MNPKKGCCMGDTEQTSVAPMEENCCQGEDENCCNENECCSESTEGKDEKLATISSYSPSSGGCCQQR